MAQNGWNNSLSVEIAQIDKQHKRLFALIGELNDAMKAAKARQAVGGILQDLLSYTKTHFALEENYFYEFDYPQTQDHMKEHQAFVDKISAYTRSYLDGNTQLHFELMNFMKDWLVNHIMGTDKKYVSFFHEHGLK